MKQTGIGRVYRKYKTHIWMIIGMLAACMTVYPYLILRTNSTLKLQDQMDGELLNYIFRAKYLFRGNIIPEFMNGMPKASMILPAPFGVILFKLFSPFAAFVILQLLVSLVGYFGMRGLCIYLHIRMEVATVIGVLFSLIPFYPVYGFTVPGQPLLVLCYLYLLAGGKKRFALPGIALYAGFSSLALTGYAWVAIGAVTTLLFSCLKKYKNNVWRSALAWMVLTGSYLATNLELVTSMGDDGFVTHRTEMIVHPITSVTDKIKELLFEGALYNPVYSKTVLLLTAVFLIATIVMKLGKNETVRKDSLHDGVMGRILFLTGAVFADIVLAVLWNTEAIVKLRESLGGMFVYFQADRITWILPFLWMLLMASELEVLCAMAEGLRKKEKPESTKAMVLLRRMVSTAIYGVCLAAVLLQSAYILKDSTLNKNIRLLVTPGYKQLGWKGFYMEEVFARIDQVIGADKQSKSVVCLGISPAVTLYNGYICADGYSNNYDVEYKHAFRRIVAGELAKREDVRENFDGWGNRLYLATADWGTEALISKSFGVRYSDLDFDINAMRDLNIGYIFAAAKIENAEELGIELVSEQPFTDEESYYEIWLYKIP